MLNALSIRNIVLIDQLDLALDSGLTVLTGETGAGKSILLDALALAMGGRGDASLVRSGAESGQVVAVLSLEASHPARQALRDNEITDDAEMILRRVQYRDGRTRAFINDQPVSAALLQQVGRQVIEIHGQHDDRALVDVATHRVALDSFGGQDVLVRGVRAAHQELSAAEAELEAERATLADAQAREEFARHVVEELSALHPEPGEEEELAERRTHLMQLEKAASEIMEVDEALSGPDAPGQVLAGLLRRLTRKVDSGAAIFAPLVEAIDGALGALDGADEALQTLKREMDFDPGELEQVEQRLFALRAMARKHQVAADDLPEVLSRHESELIRLQAGAGQVAALETRVSALTAAYHREARRLSEARADASAALSAAVEGELPDLRLGAARFIVDQQVDEARIAPSGYDQVAFHVQTNPGTAPGPLLKVASGGELSRFLLALKVVLADRGSAPVLIFDEIDSGVGGAVADAIGRRLARLAGRVQVLTVTHAPQVAAAARSHLLIEKQSEGAFTRTFVRPLDGAARREEVARMLAGAKVTDEARAAAGRLLSEVE